MNDTRISGKEFLKDDIYTEIRTLSFVGALFNEYHILSVSLK